jgi:hypothetical protein
MDDGLSVFLALWGSASRKMLIKSTPGASCRKRTGQQSILQTFYNHFFAPIFLSKNYQATLQLEKSCAKTFVPKNW